MILAAGGSPARAAVQDGTCPPYAIEGTIEPVASGDGDRVAAVYVHTDDRPAIGQRIFATFTTADDQPVGEPVVLTTDDAGRATVTVPAEATTVTFMADGPTDPACLVAPGTEPTVALEILPTAAPLASVPAPPGRSADGPLAKTGPVSDGVVAAAVLLGAAGCGMWLGRGRGRRAHPLVDS